LAMAAPWRRVWQIAVIALDRVQTIGVSRAT
jgi:hypothetical protein